MGGIGSFLDGFFGVDKYLKEQGIDLNQYYREGRTLINSAVDAILAKYGIPFKMEDIRQAFRNAGVKESQVDDAVTKYLSDNGIPISELNNASSSIPQAEKSNNIMPLLLIGVLVILVLRK
jgi:hypothetical protein